jgi:WD40 repeat protein
MGAQGGVILAYKVHTHKKLKQNVSHSGSVHCLVRGPVGVFSRLNDFTMVQWNITRTETCHAGGVRCIIALSVDRVWTGGDEGAIRIWDVESGTTVDGLVRHTSSVLGLITTGEHIWNASGMEWFGALKGHARYLSSFARFRVMETHIIWSGGLGE